MVTSLTSSSTRLRRPEKVEFVDLSRQQRVLERQTRDLLGHIDCVINERLGCEDWFHSPLLRFPSCNVIQVMLYNMTVIPRSEIWTVGSTTAHLWIWEHWRPSESRSFIRPPGYVDLASGSYDLQHYRSAALWNWLLEPYSKWNLLRRSEPDVEEILLPNRPFSKPYMFSSMEYKLLPAELAASYNTFTMIL